MTLPDSELPDDIEGCHALIRQLRAELGVASERLEQLRSVGAMDTAARIEHLEASVDQCEKTIAEQQRTIENLAADNALLRRSLFGVDKSESGLACQCQSCGLGRVGSADIRQ